MYPGPWEFDAYLRRQASFKETWLDGLRFADGDLAVDSVPITAKFPSLNSKMSGQVCPVPLPRSRGEAPTRRTIFKSVPMSVERADTRGGRRAGS